MTCLIVIPAHDEASVLGRLLRSLQSLDPKQFETVVVANGCSDDTALIAASFGVEVLELEVASKSAAISAALLRSFRSTLIVLDADIEVEPSGIRALHRELNKKSARIGSLRVQFETGRSSGVVKRFYEVFEQLPYVQNGLTGLGLYGLSPSGRSRITPLPDLISDDLFVQSRFTEDERVVLRDYSFQVQVPKTLSSLIAVRRRVARGNKQLIQSSWHTPGSRPQMSSLAAVFRQMCLSRRGFVNGCIFIALVSLARLLNLLKPGRTWERDWTTRREL